MTAYAARLQALRAKMPREIDALVVSNLTNVRYACGFTGSSGMLLVERESAHFITDFRYQAQAALQVDASFQTVIADKGLWKQAAKLLKKKRAPELPRIGFEAEHTSVAASQDAAKEFAPLELISTRRLVEDLRLHKDEAELLVIRRAVQVIDECFDHICGVLKPGISEREVADELQSQMKARGASGPSFDTIVASGARGALPHGVASEKKIERGDMVTIDMGAIVDGYCSDCTRTVAVGKPSKEQRTIYETVWRAQVAASEAMRPGLGCKATDKIARDIIEAAGFGANFGHGLGHGVGLEIHEAPRLSKLGKGRLEAGMIVTCEPGIYVEGVGGVRIEDMLLITDSGAEVLTGCAKPEKIIVL